MGTCMDIGMGTGVGMGMGMGIGTSMGAGTSMGTGMDTGKGHVHSGGVCHMPACALRVSCIYIYMPYANVALRGGLCRMPNWGTQGGSMPCASVMWVWMRGVQGY